MSTKRFNQLKSGDTIYYYHNEMIYKTQIDDIRQNDLYFFTICHNSIYFDLTPKEALENIWTCNGWIISPSPHAILIAIVSQKVRFTGFMIHKTIYTKQSQVNKLLIALHHGQVF